MEMIDTSPGTVIANRFGIEAPAGSGGMGTVFRARDLQKGSLVALKLLPGGKGQPQDLERFLREAQLLAELEHPGIVSYVSHGIAQGVDQENNPLSIPYLAMEWLEGEGLDVQLAQKQFTVRESLLLIKNAAEALAVAHKSGIVHRDLKPSEVVRCRRHRRVG